eukprot:CAMPEP_0178972082 /NCGR_PEP_ID=MMETSP0789-20121207/20764_1 /TAXON_ID=3005 /ORGANISM="Rhizosolenia setigera, Strain CCMP 1694" /LENGTH=120 /DNA_ID=CAMNT_0020659387 /DNA_START=1 /DNA_END=363 /DNA_ORIENTATION=+
MYSTTMIRVNRLIAVTNGKRNFSSSPAVQRLKFILQEYKEKNYTQELPTRFIKDIVKTVDPDKDGFVSLENMQKLIGNIGASKNISQQDLKLVLMEGGVQIGGLDRSMLPVEKIQQLLKC